jgi:uncharacterized membrane protein YhiD involved in acid resistance
MLSEIKIWVLVGVAGVMATVLGYMIRLVTVEVIKRLDEIVSELKQLTQATTIQGQQIKGLQEQDTVIHSRLNEHSDRIRSLEINGNQNNLRWS